MSRTGMIMAAAVTIALVGAGTGVYFFLDQDQAVGIEIKDQFEVGDKHTLVWEQDWVVEVSQITTIGEDLRFDVDVNGITVDEGLTYEDLTDNILSDVIFDESEGAIETGEARIPTIFGDRDCIVYTLDYGDGSKNVYYVGENNDVVYTIEYQINNVVIWISTIEESCLFIETIDDIRLKEAGDIDVGDSAVYRGIDKMIFTIEKINPSDGDAPITYDVREFGDDDLMTGLTRDDVLDALTLVLPEDVDADKEQIGTERVGTSLGKVRCDVYTYTDEDDEIELYVSNGIVVKLHGEFGGTTETIYWEYTDLVVRS